YLRLSLCYQPEELEICSYSTTSSDALLLLPPSISSTSHVSKKFLIFDFGPFLKEGKLTNRFIFVVFRFKGFFMNCLCTLKQDVNFSQADDMDEPIGTQSLEGLSQASYVPDFDPSQTNNDNDASDWWTPMTTVRKLRKGGSKQSNAPLTSAKWDRWTGGPSKKLQLSDSPMADDGSPQASLYYFTEESWDRFTKWSTNPTALRIGPSVFNLTFAQRIVCAGKWLGNEPEELEICSYSTTSSDALLLLPPSISSTSHVSKKDVNFSQADDMDEPIGTQSLEGLSQASYVPDFDPSQTNNDNDASDWWTPMTNVRKLRKGGSKQSNAPVTSAKWDRWTGGPSKKLQLSDSPMAADGSPQASLYYFTEESWDRFTKWSTNPTALRIGPSVFNLTFAQRIVCAGKWLGNEEMDAMMYIWREKTSLRRWNIDRVAFMNAMFCLQIEKEYEKCKDDKRGYVVPDLLLAYGRGELPSHGRTNRVWGVDVDRLYFPLFVNVHLFTSTTVKNPGRLFHCCPMGSEMDKTHLFKWTDKSVVEEIEDFQDLFDVLLVDNSEFQKSVRASETMLKRHKSRLEEMEDAIARSEENSIKCIRELRIIKALFVCCFAMVFMYLTYA
ncbi:hypothetical protein HID58_080949, partial [Brassica napus]